MVELIKPSDFPSLSRFDPDLVELRDKWSGSAICEDHQWHRISENETSDSSPFDVRDNDNLRGKAKPGHLDPSVSRAAHEKIAADLAAMLDLPIPPATLYRLLGLDVLTDPRIRPFVGDALPIEELTNGA